MLKNSRRKRDLKLAETPALPDSIVLEQGAGFLLRIASARANGLFEELTAQSTITPQQYGTLLTLHQRGTLTPSELAEAIHTDRRTLVRLGKNGEDGRSKKVSITAAGEAALHRLAHGGVRVQDALLSAVPTKHRPLFVRYLKLVALGPA